MGQPVSGLVNSGVTDTQTGNAPVKIGAIFKTTPPTVTDAQIADLQADNKGNLKTTLVDASGSVAIKVQNAPDATPSSTVGLFTNGLAFKFNGSTWDRERTPNVFKTLSAVVITSETTIWTPAGGKKFRLMGFCLAQGVATGAVTLKDNTAGSTILIIPPNTIGVYMISPPMGNGILSAAANNVLTATGASTETLTGFVFGTEE